MGLKVYGAQWKKKAHLKSKKSKNKKNSRALKLAAGPKTSENILEH